MKRYPIFIFFLFIPTWLLSQQKDKLQLQIIVKDSITKIPVRDVFIECGPENQAQTDYSGYTVFNTNKGIHSLNLYHVSYGSLSLTMNIQHDTILEVLIHPLQFWLQDANISDKKIIRKSYGKVDIAGEIIRKSPSLLATADPMRYLNTLSGVTTANEITSGIYVRGGGYDQTWIRIDNAPVYNSSHLYGFSSILNASSIQSLSLYKSNLPGDFGTKGSALIDVKLQSGSLQKTSLDFELGLLNSAFSFSTPIIKDKLSISSYIRYGYPLLLVNIFAKSANPNRSIYYYDWYNKIHYKCSKNRNIDLTIVNYADRFEITTFGFYGGYFSGNAQRWNSSSAVLNFYGLRKKQGTFNFNIGTTYYNSMNFDLPPPDEDEEDKTILFSKKSNFQSFFANGNHTGILFNSWKTNYGFNMEYSRNTPYHYTITDNDILTNYMNADKQSQINIGIYYFINKSLSKQFEFTFGNRTNLIPYDWSKIKNTWIINEPRVNLKYKAQRNIEYVLSYERSSEIQHIIAPSGINVATDFWFLSSKRFRPQIANQYATGVLWKLGKHTLNTELYYKPIKYVPDFMENIDIFRDFNIIDMLTTVSLKNYGIEIDHEYYSKQISWHNSLTLSKSWRYNPEINNGKPYVSNYDIPIKFNSNISFKFNKKWEFTANFILQSGAPYTGYLYPLMRSDINEFRLPIYHRLDIAFFYHKPVKPGSKTSHSWNLSIYNVYNRLNPISVGFLENGKWGGQTVFPIMPTFNYILKIR